MKRVDAHRLNRRAFVLGTLLAPWIAGGCGVDASKSRMFAMKGVVRKVDAGSNEITITHEAIPGLMAKMTMPFTIKDGALLEDVRPGDEVEGILAVAYSKGEIKDFELTSLTVTRPSVGPQSEGGTSTSPPPVTLKPGDEVPDVALTTQDGSTLRLSELRGRVVILTFIYTRCPSPEYCPAIDAKFAELARRIAAVPGRSDRIRLLSISFDPAHDTPEILAEHALRRGAIMPLWTFSVASAEELAKIAGPLGLTYVPGTREIDHNLRTAVVGPDGRLVLLESGAGWEPTSLLKAAFTLIPGPRK